MADGAYRFHQAGNGQFYYPQHNQHNNHRNLNRATSPLGARRPFNNDTPSPSRSPVTSAPPHNSYNMYSHNGHQGHGLLNGGQNHQRFGPMQKYQHHNQHPHHNQANHHMNQHQQGGQMGHQYNLSSGNLSNVTPHLAGYTPNQQHNGLPDNMDEDEIDEPTNEHYQRQMQLAQECRAANTPHYYARTLGHEMMRNANTSTHSGGAELHQTEEQGRVAQTPKNPKQVWEKIDFSGQGIRALSSDLFRYDFLSKLYLGHNKIDHLPPAVGHLKHLTHLDVSCNQLRELPREVGMLTNLEELLLVDNQIDELPYELGFCFNIHTLAVEGNPLDEAVKDKIMNNSPKAFIEELRENMPEPELPRERDWINLDETSSASAQTDRFSAMSYNILAEKYATRTQYGHAPDSVLKWDNRKNVILDEINGMNVDLVCLQELDKISYDEFFRTKLSIQGYKSYYAQKSRAETLGEQGKYVDGCGIFWRDKKYISLDQQFMVFGRKAVERPGAKASADMLNRVWQRDDIAIVTLLENRVTGSRLIVANAHVYWNPVYKDVQLIQVAVLMEELSKFAEKSSKHPPCTNKKQFRFSDAQDPDEPQVEPGPSLEYARGEQIPMVICGDFNSGATSAVYDLLAHGGIESKHTDLSERNYGSFSDSGMTHPFTLKSAYAAIGELPFTNYTPAFTDVLDYIWYSSNALRVTGLLGKVDEEYLKRVPGFPHFHFPSDHLALQAEFVVTGKKAGKVVQADFGPQRDRRS